LVIGSKAWALLKKFGIISIYFLKKVNI
jgi:hypothetical protein